jgi:hypothetical protein
MRPPRRRPHARSPTPATLDATARSPQADPWVSMLVVEYGAWAWWVHDQHA